MGAKVDIEIATSARDVARTPGREAARSRAAVSNLS